VTSESHCKERRHPLPITSHNTSARSKDGHSTASLATHHISHINHHNFWASWNSGVDLLYRSVRYRSLRFDKEVTPSADDEHCLF
jgi:hypothetical protein